MGLVLGVRWMWWEMVRDGGNWEISEKRWVYLERRLVTSGGTGYVSKVREGEEGLSRDWVGKGVN